MALSNVTDGNFDTALGTYNAAATHPYGNVSRVDSVVDADPNSHIEITCTCATSGVNVELSYEDVVDIDEADRKVFLAHAVSGVNGPAGLTLRRVVDLLDGYMDLNVASPWTPSDAELQAMVRVLGPIVELTARQEWRAYTEKYGPGAYNTVSVSAVDDDGSGAGTTGTVTITLGGQHTHMLVTFVDGVAIDSALEPTSPYTISAHDFGGAGTYAVRAVAIGPGGIVEDTFSLTIAIA